MQLRGDNLCLLVAARRVRWPINGALNMSCNTVLARVELAANNTVLAEGATDSLTDGTDGAVGVELLANGAGGGDY
jgi:hypothetical protein